MPTPTEAVHQVRVDAPRSAVFALLADPDRLVEWMSVVELHEARGEGPTRAGSTFRQVWNAGSVGTLDFEGRVTVFEPGVRLGLALSAAQADVETDYVLDEDDGGTRISISSRVAFKGMLKLMAGSLSKAFKDRVGKQLDADFERFRTLLGG